MVKHLIIIAAASVAVYAADIKVLVSQNAGAWITVQDMELSLNPDKPSDVPDHGFTVMPNSSWLRSSENSVRLIHQFENGELYKGIRKGSRVEMISDNGRYIGEVLSREGDYLLLRSDDEELHYIRENKILEIKTEEFHSSSLCVSASALTKDKNIKFDMGFQSPAPRWTAEYDLIRIDEHKAVLYSYFRLSNFQNGHLKDAEIHLIAGEIETASGPAGSMYRPQLAKGSNMAMESMPEVNAEMDNYLYTLPYPTDIKPNSEERLPLYEKREIKILTFYVVEGFDNRPAKGSARVEIHFGNSRRDPILPAGRVNITNSDDIFLAGTRIRQYGSGEEVELSAGNAEDVRFERIIVDRKRMRNYEDVTVMYKLINNSSDDKDMLIRDRIHGNMSITDSSVEFREIDSERILFDIEVKAGKSAEFTYSYSKVF